MSCRRIERALIGLRIPFWLKIAVVFATALCIRAEGVQPCCPAVGLKAEGIQPGFVAIGIISEEAKPLSSDYVCSLSSYCCRDGSFEDFGYGSAGCSQPNSIQDYEPGKYPGVSTPLRRCHVRTFGVARREALIKSTKQCFSEEALMSPWSVGAPMDQPEMISGPPTLSRLWVGVTSPSLAASIALERSLWINQLHHPCVQKTSVFAYLVMKFAGPGQDNCGRAVCLPSQKARSALVYLASTDLDSVEEGAPAKRRRISSVGVITDEVQKRLLERLSKGYLGAYLWESGIRGQDVENCLKAERPTEPGFCGGRCTGQAEENIVRGCDHRRGPKEAAGTFIKGVFRCLFVGEWHQRPRCRELPKGRTTFGSGCLGYFCLAELYEGLRKSQDRRGAGHALALSYESAWEADRACLGIYSRVSVWASGFARNEPCLPGCIGGSEPEDQGSGLRRLRPWL